MIETGIKLDFTPQWPGAKPCKCKLMRGEYDGNKRTALQLVDAKTGEAVAWATTNLPDVHLADNEVIIKDYAENAGMLASLTKAGVVSDPVRWMRPSILVKVPVCKLLLEADDAEDENGQD
jgi:hypothetical protein